MNQPNTNQPLQFLAISGSLRAVSSTTTLLRAAAQLAPHDINITLYTALGDLPHFNPDLDGEAPPPTVVDFRAQLQQADAVIICSPEYAHGVPGVLKNALDWIVGSGELMHKPVALINASVASTHAQAALTETLTVMMARVHATRLPLASNKIDEATILANPQTAAALRQVIADLASLVAQVEPDLTN